MTIERPQTQADLFSFYYQKFKPLYSRAQIFEQVPVETWFEIGAAFDHLSRISEYGDPEPHAVARAAAHLKRGCFDIFKIILREVRRQYAQLRALDLEALDCGQFKREMNALWQCIRVAAVEARNAEGDASTPERWSGAFGLWEKVYEDCERFWREFCLSDKVV